MVEAESHWIQASALPSAFDGVELGLEEKRSAKARGCIPFRYRNSESEEVDGDSNCGKVVEVLMISSSSGPGLLYPKGRWENDETVREAAVREAVEEAGVRGILMDLLGEYEFKSKSHQDEFSPDGVCKAAMYAMYVKEELESWPEQELRTRTWLTVPDALEKCRHAWMKCALEEGFCKWYQDKGHRLIE